MDLTRRRLIQLGGMGLLASACTPFWVDPRGAGGLATDSTRGAPLLVAVFLRGGADGLHLLPPTGDAAYARLRGGLALDESLPFTGGFGLHPGLEPLLPLVERGQLAVVHAAGSPHPTRSHFEAQDYMEAGEPGGQRLATGWLARALDGRADQETLATLALAEQLPLSLRGSGSFAMSDIRSFGVPGASRESLLELARLYAGQDDEVGRAGLRALRALADFQRRITPQAARRRARRGQRRAGPNVLLRDAATQVVEMERAGIPLRAICLESGGWDTHLNQGRTRGQMAVWIGDLGDALAKLCTDLGERRDLLVVVMTEFGRTVRPNGGGGTDHGHGSVMLVAGPRVRGGVYGDWRGLGDGELYEGRDLPVTTDYRSVALEVLRAHLGGDPPAGVFPDFEPHPLGLLAS